MAEPRRIVSLLPSATEMVCALGLGTHLVGRSHECDYPASVGDLPICTAPRFDTAGSSRQIDERVKDLLGDALSLYTVDVAMLRELAPDLIVTQSQCEVCAVSLADVERAVATQIGAGARVTSLAAVDLAGIFADLKNLGQAAGVERAAREVVAGLEERVRATLRAVSGRARPRVLALEWLDPLMSAGNWVPDLIESAGGLCVHGRSGEHSAWLEWDEIASLAPDAIVLMPCGFDIERTLEELALLTARPQWAELPAVRAGAVFVTDGNQYFNRPGPRIADSLEMLAEMLHAGAVPARHEGAGWARVARVA